MSEKTMITGFVLAGGRSSRMGREKAALLIDGRPMIEHVIERLRPCVSRLCVIAHPCNLDAFNDLDVDAILTDIAPSRGPLMGVYTGLMHTATALNVFAACDMPGIEPALIDRLLAAWQPGCEAIAGTGPEGRPYPLPMLCHVSARRTVGALLDARREALHELLSLPTGRAVGLQETECRRWFVNVNTLDDYATLCNEPAIPFRR